MAWAKSPFSASFRGIEKRYREAGHARGVHSGEKGQKRFDVTIQWNGDRVEGVIYKDMSEKMGKAVKMIRFRTVKNITKRVVLYRSPGSPVSRSKPGMYPYFDTGKLAHSILGLVKEYKHGSWEGYVYTNVDYSLYLERDLDRSFLVRTFNENYDALRRLFGKRIPTNHSWVTRDPGDEIF